MPIYEFTCQCGFRFERIKSMAKADDPEKCPECSTVARRIMSPANFAFAHKVVGGPRPQNTGIHSIDYNADRVIGRDSEQKWKVAAERQAIKRQVIKDTPGATGKDLTHTYDDAQPYAVMKPEERRAVETARALNRGALNAIEATKTPKAGEG